MKALCWHGPATSDRYRPRPEIEDPRDVIVKITSSGICGSDLHLLDGFMPTMETGDVLGHEPMGVVVEVGSAVKNLKKGDRVVVPFTISCGNCCFCKKTLFSLLRHVQPQRRDRPQGDGPLAGGPVRLLAHARRLSPGGQAEYLRVPFADVGPIKIESGSARREGAVPVRHLPDRLHGRGERRDRAGRHRGGLGLRPGRPVRHPERLDARGRPGHRHRPRARAPGDGRRARARPRRSTSTKEDVYDALQEMTKGRGPDRCIDAVGCEAHGRRQLRRRARQGEGGRDARDRPRARAARGDHRAAARAAPSRSPASTSASRTSSRSGAFMNKGLTMKTGQTHVQRYMRAAAEEDRGGRDRPVVRHHAPRAAGEGAGDVQDVPRQEGRLHQGGAKAMKPCRRHGVGWRHRHELPHRPARGSRACGPNRRAYRYGSDDLPGICRRVPVRSVFRCTSAFMAGRCETENRSTAYDRWPSARLMKRVRLIRPRPDGHLQATGRDARGRKQYPLSSPLARNRDDARRHRLGPFGKALADRPRP